MKELSIIVPIGFSKSRSFLYDRLLLKLDYYEKITDRIEFIYVEGFSSVKIEGLEKLIRSKNQIYIKYKFPNSRNYTRELSLNLG